MRLGEIMTNETRELLKSCFERGMSPAEAVDYLGVTEFGWTQSQWANIRGRRQPTISENLEKAWAKMSRPEWCGRGECPHCQGHDLGPEYSDAGDCPFMDVEFIDEDQQRELMEKHGVKSMYTSLFCPLCGSEETTTLEANKEVAHVECDDCGFDWAS